MSAGEYFGEGSLVTNKPRNAHVFALGDVVLWKLSIEKFNLLPKELVEVVSSIIFFSTDLLL